MEPSLYSPANMERRQLMILFLFLMAACLPTLTVSYPGSVPQHESICKFVTEHPSKKTTNGDFKLVLMNDTHEIPCYKPNEFTKVNMVVTSNEHYIRGLVLGVRRKDVSSPFAKIISSGIIQTQRVCEEYITYGHKDRLAYKNIEFEFYFTSPKRVELRTTVVFKYEEFIDNRTYYFNACPTPTPTPSSTPAPSSTPSSQTPSVTPTPTSCPSYTATQIDNFKCPKTVEKYKLAMDHEGENGVQYNCTTTGTLRHFIFPKNCTRQEVCSTAEDQVCHWRTFSITNCQMSLDQRKREFLCAAKNNPNQTLTTKLRIGIERDQLYTCNVALLDS